MRPPEDAEVFALDGVNAERVERSEDWRDAVAVPAGRHRIELEAIPAGGALRIGVALRRLPGEVSRIFVLAGDEAVARFAIEEPMQWLDHRIDLSAHGGRDVPCQVLIDSDVDLYLSHCELVPVADERPNVVVFLIDTLRHDRLGCYGYERDTSPHMDALAADGVRLTGMVSQSSWTRPAVASLLTSTYPSVHQANDRADILRQDLATVADVFGDARYVTQGFMSNATCLPMWGFGRGFTRYLDIDSYTLNPGKDADVVDAVLDALDDVEGRPWFFYVHTVGPHAPYEPPAPYDAAFVTDTSGLSEEEAERIETSDQYDGEIAFTDAQVGRLVESLHARGLYDNTWFVVVSDHGEEFWEHGGLGHGISLYDELIRIPCIVKPPRVAGGVVADGICEIVDIAPTLVESIGAPIPDSFQGRSLAKILAGGTGAPRLGYSSLYLDDYSEYGARSRDLKYIRNIAAGAESWFDLRTDPNEHAPLAGAPADGDELARYASRVASSGKAGLHILVTGSLLEEHTIEGTVVGDGLGDVDLRYLANNGDVRRTEEGVAFRITTSPGENSPREIVYWHEEGAEQNNAHVHIDAPFDEPLRLSVTLDGEPAPKSAVFVGAAMESQVLNDAVLTPEELVAGSEQFDPVALPRRLAVYVWYVPGPETIADEDLDPDMAEALGAMGYL